MAASLPEKGTRIRVVHWDTEHASVDDNKTVPPGTEGTVTGRSGHQGVGGAQIWVNWDNGSTLMLLENYDQWEEI